MANMWKMPVQERNFSPAKETKWLHYHQRIRAIFLLNKYSTVQQVH